MLSPLYGQLSPLRVPTTASFDPAVAQGIADTYISAVEAADGQSFEQGVKDAISNFVIGCHQDNIWPALKASCILAGARTLAGALVPLVGTAPTNFNFVSADYNRKSGLKGNGSTKYLNSNRNNNADPQNNFHMSVFYSEPESSGRFTAGVGSGEAGVSQIGRRTTGSAFFRNRSNTLMDSFNEANASDAFCGSSRSNSTGYNYRYNSLSGAFVQASQSPFNNNITIFRTTGATPGFSRLSFYSLGESLDLALLKTRVSTLMTDLAAAIP